MQKMETPLIFVTTLLYVLAEGNMMFGKRDTLFLEDRNGGQEETVVAVVADIGTNHSLPCGRGATKDRPVMWGRQGYGFAQNTIVQPDGSLFFTNLQQSNAGLYSCQLEFFQNDVLDGPSAADGSLQRNKKGQGLQYPVKTWFHLKVRTPPHELRNVTVLASTILASVIWETGNDGGYPISSFHIRYRLKNGTEQDWIHCQPDLINPMQRHWDVFHLCPKSTYIFEIWANNQLGKGVSTYVEAETHNDLEEIQVGKYLLEGVDTFDTRIWLVAVGVVLGTLVLLGVATCCLLYKEYYYSPGTLSRSIDPIRRRPTLRLPSEGDEEIELIPNIIFNPIFDMTRSGRPEDGLQGQLDDNPAPPSTSSSSNSFGSTLSRGGQSSRVVPTRV